MPTVPQKQGNRGCCAVFLIPVATLPDICYINKLPKATCVHICGRIYGYTGSMYPEVLNRMKQ